MSVPEDIGKEKGLFAAYKLAEAYIPIQIYGETFDPKAALIHGTLFPELYRPYPVRPKV
ncbi:spore coat associated protein CotJA [Tepidanaerobacter sp. EBM-38]|uniref:spore coat associated protein CotJA n=1 Tax=Tepidanaerobacter sp. EBM-38 TaxID=1918496 RepID=UPI000AB8A267|nr:spore coat associated protein CotJA [Tepidanaerobacter sp. EBM-38]